MKSSSLRILSGAIALLKVKGRGTILHVDYRNSYLGTAKVPDLALSAGISPACAAEDPGQRMRTRPADIRSKP